MSADIVGYNSVHKDIDVSLPLEENKRALHLLHELWAQVKMWRDKLIKTW